MMHRLVAIAATALFVEAAAAEHRALNAEAVAFLGSAMTDEDIALGARIYAGNCASCHGADLEGQSDWKRRLPSGLMPAPPHDETGHTWHHSDRDLFTITKFGVAAIVPGYESDMPAFEGVLTDAEIKSVLAFIKSTWPERQLKVQERLNGEDGI